MHRRLGVGWRFQIQSTYYSPPKVLRFETGEVGTFSPACTPEQHSGEALDTQFVDKQFYGHSSVLSAKTEPMNKHFLPQVMIGVVGDSQW